MSGLTSRAHRYFAGTVAGAALAVAANTNIHAQPTQEADPSQLPETCLKINDLSRRTHDYDEVFATVARQLQSYSGWSELQKSLNKAGYSYEAICGSTQLQSVVNFSPAQKALYIKIPINPHGPFGPAPVNAKKLLEHAVSGTVPYAKSAAVQFRGMTVGTPDAPFAQDAHDMDTRILLRSVLQSNIIAEALLFSVEADVWHGRGAEIDQAYKLEAFSSEISDLHAVANKRKKEGVPLSEADKNAFRGAILQSVLTDEDVRHSIAMGYAEEVGERFEAGHNLQAFMYRRVEAAEIETIFSQFPGNQGALPLIRNYHSFWAAKGDKDPAAGARAFIEEMKKAHAEGKKPDTKDKADNIIVIPVPMPRPAP